VAALVKDYRGGASLAGLQQTYSLGRGSVQKLLREQGVRRRRKSLTDSEIAALEERYEAGLPIWEIAGSSQLSMVVVIRGMRGCLMRRAGSGVGNDQSL
jgi:hypothetical protein